MKAIHGSLDRRGFLKGAALSAVGVGALGVLGGCSPSTDAPSSGKDASQGENTLPSWENPPAAIPESDISETKDFEIVVVGAGVAGGAAFARACEGGAKAALVEKMDTFSARGMDNAAIDTKKQAEAGIVLDKAKIVNDLVTAGGYKVNGQLIKLWADQSGRTHGSHRFA